MRIAVRLVAACALVALVVACLSTDSQGPFSGDDGDDEIAAAGAGSLPAALPAELAGPQLAAPVPAGAAFVDESQAPKSRLTVLDIFRPPRPRA
jgi:hypothetical protein